MFDAIFSTVVVLGVVGGFAYMFHQRRIGAKELAPILNKAAIASFPLYLKERTGNDSAWGLWSSMLYSVTIREGIVQISPSGTRYVPGQQAQWYFQTDQLCLTRENIKFGLPAGLMSLNTWFRYACGFKSVEFLVLRGTDVYRNQPIKIAVTTADKNEVLVDLLMHEGARFDE
jgi:hypothetical protein